MKIINMIQGYSHSYIVYSAVELGIFNALFSKSMRNQQVATELHLSPLLLERFMKVLIAMDFVYQENDRYSLTSLGEKLSNDSEDSMAAMILFNGRICMKAWGYFYEGLKNNISPIELMEGEAFFEINEMSQNRLDTFNDMMRQSSSQSNLELLFQTRKVADIKRIVDIGGGAGDVITQLLQGFPLAEGSSLIKTISKQKQRKRFVYPAYRRDVNSSKEISFYLLSIRQICMSYQEFSMIGTIVRLQPYSAILQR